MADLRAKLRALNAGARQERAPDELKCYERRAPVDARLFRLDGAAIARMGFEGEFDPRGALLIDAETTGLSGGAGTVAFLVGLGWVEGDELVVRQYLMSGYGAEPALMAALASIVEGKAALVTFNGKSFDVPLIESRMTMCRIRARLGEMPHLDLLHPARRLWKARLKRCTLASLEENVLGCPREDDLPGAEVPQRYFDFLKTRDMALLDDVIEHNRLDIVSLASLLIRLAEAYGAPDAQERAPDAFSMGKALEKRGEKDMACRCYRAAMKSAPLTSMARLSDAAWSAEAGWRLSHIMRREGDMEGAELIWREMARRRPADARPLIALSKLYEHKRRDFAAALRCAEGAMGRAENDDERAAIRARIDRLERKISGR